MAGIATEDQQRSPKDCSAAAVLTLFPRPAVHTPLSDRMSNPTAEDIVKQAQSGNTGAVKTLTDLKLEEFNKRLADLEARNSELLKLNEELRASNAELYSFAAQVSRQDQPAAVQTVTAGTVGTTLQPQAVTYAAQAQVTPAEAAQMQQKAREDRQVNDVLVEMGYAKPKNDTTPNDGM